MDNGKGEIELNKLINNLSDEFIKKETENQLLEDKIKKEQSEPEILSDKTNLENCIEPDNEELEAQYFVDLCNVFQMYFKKLYNKKERLNILEGINAKDNTSTNRGLELMYEEISKYKENMNNQTMIKLYDPEEIEIDKIDSLIGLMIDDDLVKVCPTLIPLLLYVLEFDWLNINWNIIPIK
ncbi:MAG: hypothetical protein Edafosvirus36_6 [Edafosvirus sp.]|uniref:Uncharacterized protein n=1 Tax=Edafosvirus sp. TaxID=2487765 RepID=A0A3G4ZVA3_9VIRU|nr:MAG: hypothetical protein Edafosvirus36_6 [Edafosvirus sp.]